MVVCENGVLQERSRLLGTNDDRMIVILFSVLKNSILILRSESQSPTKFLWSSKNRLSGPGG
jgi:hypothetical protein